MAAVNFFAFHSFRRMGYAYSERTGDGFVFMSNKSRAFLERAIGADVWVIEGRRDAAGATLFGLAAVFTPDAVSAEGDHFLVQGDEGREFSPPVPLSGRPWFEALAEQQGHFSLGFGEIHDPAAVAELAKVATPVEAVVPAVPPEAAPEAKPALVAEPAPEANDPASRVMRWLRQRRGNYYCHHCISRETGVMPAAQINQICRPLQKAPKEWRFGEAPCAGCGRERKAIAYIG